MSRVETTTKLECGANPVVAHSAVPVSVSGPTHVMHAFIIRYHGDVRCSPKSGMRIVLRIKKG